ncbi:alpha-L-arabinofuranosidase C-terminal domain-containing protein [Microbacterium sp. NPDC019599]|uniref:alpha-L-arabinofuranosidase C-terminal domain-containing protein n=1 Tax=Microbacterium sp. NPDC019599 TaxID=3154690 RepID=UPI0033F68A0A
MSEELVIRIGGETGVDVAPDLWGLFFEDINTSLDGGLNAELVRNGDFEFTPLDHPEWGPLTAWTVEGAGSVALRHEDPIHPNNRTYVRAVGPVRLVNEGWDGVGVEQGRSHVLSLCAWRVFGEGSLRASVLGGGAELADAALEVPPGGWNELTVSLRGRVDGRGVLAIEIPEGLTVELDAISLRPAGPDGASLTFRPDLVEALAELRPSFVRFPGGCVAHGLGLANMYTWKPTIGPRHEREQIPNLWGYHQSRQIGYFEFFELCELLGATPMPILAAGVCCQNTRGGPKAIPAADMPAYVQDVLDLVEFADGPADSAWGSVRAGMGHPEPFGLRYLGIGNEDAITDDFRERYAQLEDAVRAAHPELTVIGTVGPAPFGRDWEDGWAFARERGVSIVDEHAYRTPRWFHQNVDRYAEYARDEPGVYFGEYAARTNTVRSALAEAAFMIGMERNSDVVRLASYAPLLARVGGTQWEPDLIYFDADRVLPSASYYVQQLFSQERGERLVAASVEGAEPVSVVLPESGSVRIASPGAEFELSDLALDGVPLEPVRTAADGAIVTFGDIRPSAAALAFTAVRRAGDKGLAVQLGGEALESRLELLIPNWTGLETVVNRYDDGIGNDDDGPTPWRSVVTGEPIRVRVELEGPHVRVWIDEVLQHDYAQDLRPEHRVVVGAAVRGAGDQTEHVVRIVNATGTPRAARLVLPDGARCAGHATVLAGAGPDEGASFTASPVLPVEVAVAADGSLDLPPWSLAVAVIGSR